MSHLKSAPPKKSMPPPSETSAPAKAPSHAPDLVWPLIREAGLVAWIVMLMKVIVSSCATAASEFRQNPARMPYSADPNYLKIIKDQQGARNASTDADFGATIIGLILGNSLLGPVARRLGAVLLLTAEEAAPKEFVDFLAKWIDDAKDCVRSSKDFYAWFGHIVLGLVLDAIDGTANFAAGMDEWGSCLTLFVEGKPRVTVAYLPAEDLMVEGVLPGPAGRECVGAWATLTYVRTGKQENLVASFRSNGSARLRDAAVAYHISRSKDKAGNYRSDEFAPVFKSLTKAWKTGYAYNCGIVSIVKLLRGMVDGYVNASMPVHDACHLFTLVSAASQSPACVSDFAGRPLSLRSDERVELVAAPEKIKADILEVIRAAPTQVPARQRSERVPESASACSRWFGF